MMFAFFKFWKCWIVLFQHIVLLFSIRTEDRNYSFLLLLFENVVSPDLFDNKLSSLFISQLNQQSNSASEDLNGFIQNTPIYVTSLASTENTNNNSTANKLESDVNATLPAETKEVTLNTSNQLPNSSAEESSDLKSNHCVKQVPNDVRVLNLSDTQSETSDPAQQPPEGRRLQDRRVSSPFQNGRTELLLGGDDNKLKTTVIIESNNNNNKLGVDGELRYVITKYNIH